MDVLKVEDIGPELDLESSEPAPKQKSKPGSATQSVKLSIENMNGAKQFEAVDVGVENVETPGAGSPEDASKVQKPPEDGIANLRQSLEEFINVPLSGRRKK